MTGHSNRTVLTGDNLAIHWQHRCLRMGPRTRRPPQRAKSRHMAQVPRHVHPPFRARLGRGRAAPRRLWRSVRVFICHKRLKAPRSKTSTPMGRQPMGVEREDRR